MLADVKTRSETKISGFCIHQRKLESNDNKIKYPRFVWIVELISIVAVTLPLFSWVKSEAFLNIYLWSSISIQSSP